MIIPRTSLSSHSSLALYEDKFAFVWNWVNKSFPHDLDSYAAKPLYARLLSTVSLSLFFFQYPDRDDRPPGLDSSHQNVALSNSVLKAIPDVIQNSFPEIDGDSSDEEQHFPMVKRKRASQKAQKYAKRNRQMTKSVDATPFRASGLDVPTSSYEARKMALLILDKQKDILLVNSLIFSSVALGFLKPLCLVVVPGNFSSTIALGRVQEKLYPHYRP